MKIILHKLCAVLLSYVLSILHWKRRHNLALKLSDTAIAVDNNNNAIEWIIIQQSLTCLTFVICEIIYLNLWLLN